MPKADRNPASGVARKRLLAYVGFAFLLAATLWGALRLSERLEQLDQSLETKQRRNEDLEDRIAAARREEARQREQAQRARALAEEARQTYESEISMAEQAEIERLEAEAAQEQARQQAEQARREAEQAQRGAEALRRKRREEWERLAGALERMAPTRREDWTITMTPPADLGRETLSRLAGALLANHGYRLFIEDGGEPSRAAEIERYLTKAGVPADFIQRVSSSSANLRFVIRDTVLQPTAPATDEPEGARRM